MSASNEKGRASNEKGFAERDCLTVQGRPLLSLVSWSRRTDCTETNS
jgi:hypothetical protein